MSDNQSETNVSQSNSLQGIETSSNSLLQLYLNSQDSSNAQIMGETTHAGKHDTSGHCQQIVHVPAHTREGYLVSAYDRRCGQNHTEKEAEEKNQENANDKNKENNPSKNRCVKYNELIKEYWPHLKNHEHTKSYAYLDTEGNITTGIGLYIPDEKTFTSLPWQFQGKEATFEQKVAEYQHLNALQQSGLFGKNYDAGYYWDKSEQKLTLSDHFIIDKTMEHLEWDLKELERKLPEFETYPRTLQMALLDMQYNMGGKFNAEKWSSFYEGLKDKDITKMAEQSHRYQVGEDRNNWTRDTLLNVPLVNGWHYSSK